MKLFSSFVWLSPVFGTLLGAQTASVAPSPAPTAVVQEASWLFAPEQLDQLLGPIALYPDALIAIMLPASTVPTQVVLAARYVGAGRDPGQIDAQAWDDSVKALARYPEVLKWMDANLAWTSQLGGAFANQPTDVMNAIQRLRARAREAGTLVDTPQQQIVVEQSTITIVPAQPDVIYVPYYDPAVVYVPQRGFYAPGSFFGFSTGFAAGSWLSFGLDWGQRRVWTVDRHERERFWREHHTWRDHSYTPHWRPSAPPPIHSWQPPIDRRPPQRPPFVPPQRTWPGGPHDRNHGPVNPPPPSTTPPLWNRDARSHPPGVGPSPARIDLRPAFSQPLPSPLPNPLPSVSTGPIQSPPVRTETWRGRHDSTVGPVHSRTPPPSSPSFTSRPPASVSPAPPPPMSGGLRVVGPTYGGQGLPVQSFHPAPAAQIGPTAPPPAPPPTNPAPNNPPNNDDDRGGRHRGRNRNEQPP